MTRLLGSPGLCTMLTSEAYWYSDLTSYGGIRAHIPAHASVENAGSCSPAGQWNSLVLEAQCFAGLLHGNFPKFSGPSRKRQSRACLRFALAHRRSIPQIEEWHILDDTAKRFKMELLVHSNPTPRVCSHSARSFHRLQCLLIKGNLAAQGTQTLSNPFSSQACLCTQIGHSSGAYFAQYLSSALENMSACTLFSSMSLYNFFRESLLPPQKLSTGSSGM